MKDVVLNEIMKKLNRKEKIIVKVFEKLIIKVYNMARITTINNLINDVR